MNAKETAYEVVNLVKVYRNGDEESNSMPRWIAELEMGCIPLEQPEVARARIEPIRINRQAPYPVKQVPLNDMLHLALEMAWFLPMQLVA